MKNYFLLFKLSKTFNIDIYSLEKAYINLQSKVHPDKFIIFNNIKKKKILKLSIYVNKAYLVLKNPIKRAIYLCNLYKFNLNINKNKTIISKKILLKQIKLYKNLKKIKNTKNINKLIKLEYNLLKKKKYIIKLINKQFIKNNFLKIKNFIQHLMFLNKFKKEINITFSNIECLLV